ncbi:DeoR family transcriptional regulator [Cryobacterium ruanii]|uniref:DeoR family transcriptional regulator n=1 Tax=Cryobacterium ruanii TaxID=1259197 RepID=A0A4R9AKM6_9MICO|nr:DeoR family transcriptional regulator [Cryobacterium ruanii]
MKPEPAGTSRSADERRASILAALADAGRVEVNELAESLAVAEESIRRDLRTLEDGGSCVERTAERSIRPPCRWSRRRFRLLSWRAATPSSRSTTSAGPSTPTMTRNPASGPANRSNTFASTRRSSASAGSPATVSCWPQTRRPPVSSVPQWMPPLPSCSSPTTTSSTPTAS